MGKPRSHPNWQHVHRCPRCREVVLPRDIPAANMASGMMSCAKCEWTGPLRLEVIDLNTLATS